MMCTTVRACVLFLPLKVLRNHETYKPASLVQFGSSSIHSNYPGVTEIGNQARDIVGSEEQTDLLLFSL